MLRFLADEDFNQDIVRGVLRENPDIDVTSIQEEGLSSIDDPLVLETAAQQNRILLSHDVRTMLPEAYARIAAGQRMPGVFFVRQTTPIGKAIEEIVILAECSLEGEWEGQVNYLPL